MRSYDDGQDLPVTPSPASTIKTPVRHSINMTATPQGYDPSAKDWGNMHQAPGFKAYQDSLAERARKKKEEELRTATIYNQKLITNTQNTMNPTNQAARRKAMGWE